MPPDYRNERPSEPTKTLNSLLTLERNEAGKVVRHTEEVSTLADLFSSYGADRHTDDQLRRHSGITSTRVPPPTASLVPSMSSGRW